uniref:Putative cadherin egf lag seven-pass g-type receptor n=1 Tax=Lutzomyia longipalpis TaxID=7200 RepID=A0A1B0CCE9_LUTLO
MGNMAIWCKIFKKVRLKKFLDIQKTRKSRLPCSLITVFCILEFLACFRSALANLPPRFLIDGHSEIVLRLKEGPDTPVGSLIYRLKGFDPDGDPLTFGIKESIPGSEVLRVENVGMNQANLFLAQELDRETKDEYSIVLTLTDNRLGEGNFVTQSLLLLVEDVNDNEPVFKPFQAAIEVPEGSRPGVITTVEATDQDEGAFGQVIYYLQELDGENEVFSITTNQGKGVIRLMRDLDYERKSLYQLRILAVDRANQGKVNTGSAALLVKVKDMEDQPPEFVAVTPVIRVSEDIPVGSKVAHVKAIDGDRGVNNEIRYSMRNGFGLFGIHERSGAIITVKTLDRENPDNQINGAYIVEVVATEKSKIINPPPSVRTEITIILTDVNDETPRFRETAYECEVNENAQENTPITFLGNSPFNEVFDHDQGLNGTFDLALVPPNEIFEVTPSRAINEATFLIRVKDSTFLDFEKVTQLNFTLVAREVADKSRLTKVPIKIHIRDQNDNYPEFANRIYEVSIPENSGVGTTVGQVDAFDLDSGNYGTRGIRYTNMGGGIAHLLHLNAISGVITVKSPGGHSFDRELVSRHYLTVEARDNLGQGNRNTVQLIVNIDDVNDNSPVFVQSKYEVRLMENKVSFETPLVVEAKDNDLNGTKNSEIEYELIDGEFRENFTIDSKSGLIEPTGSMDFELIPGGSSNIRPIHLTVNAKDGGIPSLSARVPVVVYLHDVNDHAPQFQHAYYRRSIPEDLPSGSSILEVKASDKDGSSPNNVVVYRIQKGASDKFVIGSDTGVISIAPGASLDPDLTNPKIDQYSLFVVALDSGIGDQQMMTSTVVNITIIDVNNKPPHFADPGTVSVKENTPVGTYVFRLIATDPDVKPILRYSVDPATSEARSEEGAIVKLSEYDYLSAFEINAVDGLVRVVKLVDREKVEQIKLGFTVEDIAAAKGRQLVPGALSIVIEDENDNSPKFRKPFYKRSIMENSPNGVTIVNIVAYDVDKNRTITYSLEGPSDITSLVHLDSESGEIVVANKIDHEVHKWLNFTVKATDSGVPSRSSLVEVFLDVIDENDNRPYFLGDMRNFSVSENAPIGTKITTVRAEDADSGDFGKITYLMDRISSQGKFTIDADTGVITVADKLDREIKDDYMIVIEAWDNYQFGYLSGESRNTFKQLFIKIIDENDSPPVLHFPVGCVQITEYHDLREFIAKIKATDADDPKTPNGVVEFELLQNESADHFKIVKIDSWSAAVFAKHSLQGFYGNYTLMISGRDLGTPANIVTKKLEICVSDFNDHAPIFISPANNVTIRIPENATIGSSVIQVIARDDDVGPNAAVLYRLKPDPIGSYRMFDIDAKTGMITLKHQLDRERQRIHEIRVEAYDQGIPTPLSSDLDLTVYVRNVNDYEPQFLVDEITVNFTEHSPPGSEKKKLPDTVDRDEVDELDDPPSIVCYYIVYGNEEKIFQLDPESHILTVSRELDREVKANHTLIIKATEDCVNVPRALQADGPISAPIKRQLSDTNRTQQARTKTYSSKYVDYFDRYKHSRNLRSIEEDAEFIRDPIFESLESGALLSEDSTLVRVTVFVNDINDNAPKFSSKVFTGGVSTAADFGVKFMQIKAVDKDDGDNAKITYYLVGSIHRTLTEGLENLQKPPFLVDVDTGEIQLNFDPLKGMKGYFDFMVIANDTDGLQDVAHVFIYLLRSDQRVKIVLRQQPPEVRAKVDDFRRILGNVTNAIVNVDDFRIHENKDGSVDKTKTDVYLHLVDPMDNSILDVGDVLRLIDQNIEKLDDLFKEFNVLDTQPAEALLLTSEMTGKSFLIWLVFSNLIIGGLLIIVLGLCMSQRSNYKRQLRAARVNTYGPGISDLAGRGIASRVPNTNKHSIEGSNPIWLKAYENEWFKNDDNFSNGSGNDSIDENIIVNDQYNGKKKEINTQNDMNRQFNVYQQIDKLTNAHILAKKLETTEL